MSLRDAFLAKGLVSKKDAERVARELRDERKHSQGSRQRKSEVEREEAERKKAEAAALLQAQAEARELAAREREAHEQRYRVRQIILGNRLSGRGPVPFHHRIGDTGRIGRMMLSEATARELRNGRAAIAGFQDGGWSWFVVTRRAAEKLHEVAPEALAHWVREEPGRSGDPADSLMQRSWEGGLGPHRARDEAEVERLRRAAITHDAASQVPASTSSPVAAVRGRSG